MLKRALLVIHTNTYFTCLLPVARMLKRSGKYEPVFFFSRTYPTITQDLGVCQAERIPCLDQNGESVKALPSVSPAVDVDQEPASRQRVGQRVKQLVLRPFRGLGLRNNVLYQLWYLGRRIRFAHQLIIQQRPALLVLAGDNAGYDTPVLTKVGHEERISSVVVPSWMGGASKVAESCLYNPVFSMERWTNRIVGAFYPRWVYEHKGRKLLRLPAGRALAMEWLGLAPPLPWVWHSGYADAIAVESEAMFQYCRQEGLPSSQLVLTGSVAHDVLAKNLKETVKRRTDLYNKLGLPAGWPMILCALSPDQLYGTGGRPECDFQTYDELVQFWMQSLADIEGYNVVISLHPSVKYEEMKYLEQWGGKIARENTVSLIPLCDVFVASISSTIQWAIACGKPVVNYDVYRYRYTDYVEVEGVMTMEEKDEFVSALRRLTQDHEFYAEMVARQAAGAGQWGRLDGHAADRMLQLFNQLTEKRTNT